jgi:hypothetical protein
MRTCETVPPDPGARGRNGSRPCTGRRSRVPATPIPPSGSASRAWSLSSSAITRSCLLMALAGAPTAWPQFRRCSFAAVSTLPLRSVWPGVWRNSSRWPPCMSSKTKTTAELTPPTGFSCKRRAASRTEPSPVRAFMSQSARLRGNAGFRNYSPDHEACCQPGRQIRQAHRHPGNAQGRSGRAMLPGSPVPVRLRTANHSAYQLALLRRCPVLWMLARPAQIRAQALPGLRNAGPDPARPQKLLPRLRIPARPRRPTGTKPVLRRVAPPRYQSPGAGQRLRLRRLR